MNDNKQFICMGCGRPIDFSSFGAARSDYTPDKRWHNQCFHYRNVPYVAPQFVGVDKAYDELDWSLLVYQLLKKINIPNANMDKIESQLKSFSKTYNYKQMYYALVYHFIIQGGNKEKAQGGVGILAYKMSESDNYWINYLNDIEKKRKLNESVESKPVVITKKAMSRKERLRLELEKLERSK